MVMHSEEYGDRPLWHSIVLKAKTPLRQTIIAVAQFLPEPDRNKTSNPNTKRLIDTWDWFLGNDSLSSRRSLWNALKKITCTIYDSENYYASRGNAFLKELIDRGWEFELPPEKASWWKEDKRL